MKSFRWTWIFAAVVLVLVALSVRDYRTAEKDNDQKDKDKTIVSIPMNDISHIEILSGGQVEMVLERKAGAWRLLKPLADVADDNEMTSFLLSLSNEKSKVTVVEGDDLNLATYGLDHPVKELIVTDDKGGKSDVKIGSVKAYDGNLYALIGKNKVVLASTAWDAHLSKKPSDLRDKHLIRADLKFADVKTLEIQSAGQPLLRAVRDGKDWKLSKGALDYPVLAEHVEDYFKELKEARLQSFTAPDKAKEFAKAGLGHPALIVRLFKDGDQPAYEAQFAPLPTAKPEHGHPVVTAAISSDLPDLLSVQKSTFDIFKRDANSFYDRKRAISFNVSDVASVTVDTPEFKNTFKKTGDAWTAETADATKTVESAKITSAIDHLSHIEPVRILAPLASPLAKQKLAGRTSKIILKKADGSLLFTFEWGAPMTESVNGVEATYLPARTNRIDFLLGVTENEVKSLSFASWLQVPGATPVPGASPASTLGAKRPGAPPPKER